MGESELQQLASALRVITQDGRSVARELLRQARRVDGIAAQAARNVAHERANPGASRLIPLLQQASKDLRQAAASLDASARLGDTYGSSLTGGSPGSRRLEGVGDLASAGRESQSQSGTSVASFASGHDDEGPPVFTALGERGPEEEHGQRDAAPVADLISQHPDLPVFREASGRKGDWNQQLNTPPTTAIVVVDKNFAYRTDQFGRVVEAVGRLDTVLSPEENRNRRNKSQQRKAGGTHRIRDLDDGGHIFAAQFGGAGEGINLLAQHKDQNRASKRLLDNWHAMEQKWRKLVEDGHVVEVAVAITYEADSLRPSTYEVSQRVDGRARPRRTFFNPTSSL